MAMGAGVGGGAANFSRLWIQQLLVAEVVAVCTAVVVEILIIMAIPCFKRAGTAGTEPYLKTGRVTTGWKVLVGCTQQSSRGPASS